MFYEKDDLKNFIKKHRKTPVPESFLNKVAGVRLQLFIEKEALAHVFPGEFFETFKSTFLTEHIQETISDLTDLIV